MLEDEEAWNGLIRDLQFEDEAETVVKKEIHSPPAGSNSQADGKVNSIQMSIALMRNVWLI